MERTAYQQLISWKSAFDRKPLILQGARQVGKTFLVDLFGKQEYKNYHYFNFEQDVQLKSFFENKLDPKQIIENLSFYIGKTIESRSTLLFFDEVQAAPNVLTSLKYFYEQSPNYHIIAAGSLLGVSINRSSAFPVGKVNFLQMYPMSFLEFLSAMGEGLIANKLQDRIETAFPEPIHEKLLYLLKQYLFLGGMPEVIKKYIERRDIEEVRNLQKDILRAYKRDFSKYTDKNQSLLTSQFWSSVPRQLAKENKKFKYSEVKTGGRARIFGATIEWLKGAGLIHIVYNTETAKIPLSAYADFDKFKVYMSDVGLLAAKLNIPSSQIVEPSKIFDEFKGAFIENFIAQELRCYGEEELFYWTSKNSAEVDYLIASENSISPIEVKSGLHRNIKSLRVYADKYSPSFIYRLSPRNFTQDNDFVNYPLYAVKTLLSVI